MQFLYHGLATLMMGDVNTANDSVKTASELDPINSDITRWSMTMTAMSVNYKDTASAEEKQAGRLVGNALLSEAWGDYATEVRMMEAAERLTPDNN